MISRCFFCFCAHIVINILCTVLLMSVFLTVLGTWIGSRQITPDPIRQFFYKWPRNFAISFAVEACIAQPIARWVMSRLHKRLDRHTPNASAERDDLTEPPLSDAEQ